jgi:hypothetical protein
VVPIALVAAQGRARCICGWIRFFQHPAKD